MIDSMVSRTWANRFVLVAVLIALTALPALAGGTTAAKIGSKSIDLSEVDAKAQAANMQAYQALYDARKAALDELVAERLMSAEASKRGVSVDELIASEITAKADSVDEAKIQAFYTENQGAMRGQPIEAMSAQIRSYLEGQSGAVARRAFINTLKGKSKVSIMLEPPRVEVTLADDDPSLGPKNAPVELVIYSEFQCPYCARIKPTLTQIAEAYEGKVRFVFRDYPLPFHDNAQKAAEAAQCAHEQEKFWPYHDKLFQNQQALAVDNLKSYAAEMGLDTERFDSCLDTGKYTARVQTDMAEGSAVGVKGTPAFFVNGRFVSGALPFEAFQAIIDEELDRAGS